MTHNGRRDMRRGKLRGSAELTSRGIVTLGRFDGPFAGWNAEYYELRDGELHIHSQLHVNGKHVPYTAIYVKH
jgi:hypothetical protein